MTSAERVERKLVIDHSMDYKIGGTRIKADNKPKRRIYSEADIQAKLEGYINVHRSLWDRIPTGAHVRYFKKHGTSRIDKFRPGGFVKSHYTDKNGKPFIMLENKPGHGADNKDYASFPVAYEDIDELWKKYDNRSFIEMHLISISLAQKKKQIDDLTARVTKLEQRLASG